ncbi:MAG: C/D box methylation guide ribonucleoprotein complex aNOP56 subunit [Promethearchaeota archaeon]|nr:MAG: C/D box methylation guide ribonucleoprotein complex aNOP56 subunit [Candidatus Lokiarchaeota archaeon]
MKCFIIDTLMGVFALDEAGNLLSYTDFNGNSDKIIEFYQLLEDQKTLEEFERFISELKNSGFNEFILDNRDLKDLISDSMELTSKLEEKSLEFRNFRLNLSEQLKRFGISKSNEELLSQYIEINRALIKETISQVAGKRDLIIVRVIETLDTIKKSTSLLSNRLREWYGLHFPELTDKIIDDIIIMAKLITLLGDRKNYTEETLEKYFDFNENLVNTLTLKAEKSMGAKIDLEILREYAQQIVSLDAYRENLEDYLEELMEKTAPNINAIVGALIGAKLIAKAGSLKKLAFMPASRIQLLGAEKALYRFLKTGEKRPKHGLIFQWNKIRSSKPWLRGKIARVLAGKIGLGSKVDYFSGDFIGDVYSKEIEEKIKEIEEKYPEPPQKSKSHKSKGKKKKRGHRK